MGPRHLGGKQGRPCLSLSFPIRDLGCPCCWSGRRWAAGSRRAPAGGLWVVTHVLVPPAGPVASRKDPPGDAASVGKVQGPAGCGAAPGHLSGQRPAVCPAHAPGQECPLASRAGPAARGWAVPSSPEASMEEALRGPRRAVAPAQVSG